MHTQTQTSTINIPLTKVKPLYRNEQNQTLVLEVGIEELKNSNQPIILDEIINQARLDYALGDYESFDNVKDFIDDLSS